MHRHKVLERIIGVSLVALLLVGCAPAPTGTPIAPLPTYTLYPTYTPYPTLSPLPKPTYTPTATSQPTHTPTRTQMPPTAAPTTKPLVTDTSRTVESGTWRITVVQLNRQTSVEDGMFKSTPKEGYLFLLVTHRLENTASVTSTLEVNLNQLAITDEKGETSLGVGVGEGQSGKMAALFVGEGKRSVSISKNNVQQVTFHLATDQQSRMLGIEIPARSQAIVTLAFPVSVGSKDLVLRWPNLTPISLSGVSAP